MKKIFVSTSIVFLLLASMGTGCEKEDDVLWEIYPESKNPVILNEVDGIEFKFCLLNEEGKPATVFNEGENFSFYFSVANNSNENFYFYPGYAYSEENNFCKIYSQSRIDKGKPFIFKGLELIGVGAYPFRTGETYIFEQSWIDNRDSKWRWKYGYYESADQEPLHVGNYFTEFQYRFRFARNHEEPALYTDTLNFKINFKIQAT